MGRTLLLGVLRDNHRIAVIATIAMLVLSGVVVASSDSGLSPTYGISYRVPLLSLFASSSDVALSANPTKSIAPVIPSSSSVSGSVQSVETSGSGPQFVWASVLALATGASKVSERSAVEYAVTAGPSSGMGDAQASGQVLVSGSAASNSGQSVSVTATPVTSGGAIVSSGQVSVSVMPGGQLIVTTAVTGNGMVFSQQFLSPSILKTDALMNGFGSNTQSSSTGLSTVTAAIPGLWLDSSKRRTKSQIYIEILELMKRGPMTPFEIAFYARLNRKRTKEYTEFLKHTGYLQEELEKETGKKVYVLTKEGFLFLERVKVLFQDKLSVSEIPKLGSKASLEENL